MSKANISIYEFSRGFEDITYSSSEKKWLFGRYGNPIDRENHPVPPEIQHAFESSLFYIRDSYPPKGRDNFIGFRLAMSL